MKCLTRFWRVSLAAILLATLPLSTVRAAGAPPIMAAPNGLSLLEFKITGDEFILLQNNTSTAIPDLSSYWLTVYNNTNPLSAGVSSSSQQLPTSGLQPGQTLLLSASPMATCGASVAGKLSLSLTDGGGFLQLMQTSLNSNGAVVQTAGDLVSWSSSTAGLIQSVPSSTKDAKAAYYRYLNGSSYTWQLADLDTTNICQLNVVVAGGSGSSSAVTPLTLAASSPPATILGVTDTDITDEAASLPVADVGLTAPQISELLPNPIGTGNDATDEFIELYNPNAVPFDLGGFSLQTGTTITHNFTFPSGTMLEPTNFHAFYASQTGLSLSNASGQAVLLDPFGNVIGNSQAYATAKDGVSWALAKGTWYWTTEPTPGGANIIKQPATKASKAAAAKAKKAAKAAAAKKTAVKGAATKLASTTTDAKDDAQSAAPIHTWVLALVGGGALLYGAYEYRRDLGNRLFQLRAKLAARREPRKPS